MGIIKFTASNFEGNCDVDEDFAPLLTKMNEVAIKHGITVVVTSSLRADTNVKGAIVTPAIMSNHLVGHAIDCNLKKGTEYFNSVKMNDRTGADNDFINECKSFIKWGGEFHKNDPVHFDDRLNQTNPDLWKSKYDMLHNKIV
ncbi:MAG: M15 family metallopeptidase [Bacteroidota bacterium]